MKRLALISGLLMANAVAAESTNRHIETAARMNVAENLCDISFGTRRGVVHHVMLGASELNVTIDYAAGLADARHREIVSYLNRAGKLDQFCRNARAGEL